MAQSALTTAGNASFGQFRLTTFVNTSTTPIADSSKPSKPAIASPLSRGTSAQSSEPKRQENGASLSAAQTVDYSQSLLPSPQPSTMSPPLAERNTASKSSTSSTKPNSFGVIENMVPAHRDGKLGPHRDGRVRNPVPRKLKGKTDDKNGNFAVMHMDMSGTNGSASIPRAEAAQRTSENTANAAKTAQKEGYVPVKRRKVQVTPIPAPASLTMSQPPQPTPPTQATSFSSTAPIQPPAIHHPPLRKALLSPDETKYEQARLLTLLRTITPITVVDQLCKALAFFGGIPSAPPPEHGFPMSENANGSGALLVGWLSEIFPDLERKEWRSDTVPLLEDSNASKRPRGRPKGSKASKARKDKGIKKGPKLSASLHDGDTGDDDWMEDSQLDMDDAPSSSGHDAVGYNGSFGQPTQMNLQLPAAFPESTTIDNVDLTMSPGQHFSPTIMNVGKDRLSQMHSSKEMNGMPETGINGNSSMQGAFNLAGSSLGATSNAHKHSSKSTIGSQNTAPAITQTNGSLASNLQSISVPPAPAASAKRKSKAGAKVAASTSMSAQPPIDASANTQQSEVSAVASSTPVVGEKRKRAPRPKKSTVTKESDTTTTPVNIPLTASNNIQSSLGNVPALNNVVQQDSGHVSRESPILPPPKRQRKPKEASMTSSKKRTASAVDSPKVAVSVAAPQNLLQSPMSNVMQQPAPLRQPTPMQQSAQQVHTTSHTSSMNSGSSMHQSNSIQQPIPMQLPTSLLQQASPMQSSVSSNMLQTTSMQKSNSMQRSTPVQQSNAIPASDTMQQSISQAMLSQAIPQAMMHPSLMASDSTLPTTRPSASRSSMSRVVAQGLGAQYDHFAALSQDPQPQPQSQQRNDHNGLARASPIPSTSMGSAAYYQSPQALQQHVSQPHHQQSQQQPTRQMSTSAYGQPYNTQSSNPYQSATPSGNTLYRNAQQHYNAQSAFSPRQQTTQQQSNYGDNTLFDLPSLNDNLSNNTTSMGPYGQSLISRTGSTGSYGAPAYSNMNAGLQLSNGFDSSVAMSDDMRDKMMRSYNGRR